MKGEVFDLLKSNHNTFFKRLVYENELNTFVCIYKDIRGSEPPTDMLNAFTVQLASRDLSKEIDSEIERISSCLPYAPLRRRLLSLNITCITTIGFALLVSIFILLNSLFEWDLDQDYIDIPLLVTSILALFFFIVQVIKSIKKE